MTKVISDSLAHFQTNHKKINEQDPRATQNAQILDEKEAVISEVSLARKNGTPTPRLTSTQADLLSHKLIRNIAREPVRALSAHRLTNESLALLTE
jgi:hypothetical protein